MKILILLLFILQGCGVWSHTQCYRDCVEDRDWPGWTVKLLGNDQISCYCVVPSKDHKKTIYKKYLWSREVGEEEFQSLKDALGHGRGK